MGLVGGEIGEVRDGLHLRLRGRHTLLRKLRRYKIYSYRRPIHAGIWPFLFYIHSGEHFFSRRKRHRRLVHGHGRRLLAAANAGRSNDLHVARRFAQQGG